MGTTPERRIEMFGRMTISPVLQLNPNGHLESAVGTLLQAAEQPEIFRWIEFPNSLLLFAIVSGNPQSGAIYILDRKGGIWYAIDFDDQEYAGYNVEQFEALLKECSFLSLVERPGLLRSGLRRRSRLCASHQRYRRRSSRITGACLSTAGHTRCNLLDRIRKRDVITTSGRATSEPARHWNWMRTLSDGTCRGRSRL